MYRSVDESNERLSAEDNVATNGVVFQKLHNGGRRSGDANLSPMMRAIIGAAAEIDDNNAATARLFDVNDRAVANYRKGRTSHDSAIQPELKADVEEKVEIVKSKQQEAREKAASRLAALFDGPINEENLATLKPREAISAAKDLATVIDRVTPKESGNDNRVQFVIFAPRVKEEKEYTSIDVNATPLDR